jgi:hypothetical protein
MLSYSKVIEFLGNYFKHTNRIAIVGWLMTMSVSTLHRPDVMNVEQLMECELAREPKYSEKTRPSATFSTTRPPDKTMDRTRADEVESQ